MSESPEHHVAHKEEMFVTKQDAHAHHETHVTHEESEQDRKHRLQREEEERKRVEDEEKVRKRQEQALMFEKYLEESGLSLSFQIIFTELI